MRPYYFPAVNRYILHRVEDIKITSEEAKGIAQKKRSLSSTLFVGRDVLLYHRRMEPMALHECIRHLVRAVA